MKKKDSNKGEIRLCPGGKNWHCFVTKIMRWTCMITCILCLSAFTLPVESVSGQPLLERKVSIKIENGSLIHVLDKLSKTSGVPIMYGGRIANDPTRIDFEVRDRTLKHALGKLLDSRPYGYKVIDGEVVIRDIPNPRQGTNSSRQDHSPDQQRIRLRGVVTDSLGAPLPGVAVFVKNTSNGTTTSLDGRYELQNVATDATVVFQMVGFHRVETPVNGQTVIDMVLQEQTTRLDEVVLTTGYQRIPKERATGSFASVDNELFNRRVSVDVLSRLDGVTSGLVINRTSTSEPTISIRGSSTIYADQSPLIVLDGFPFDGDIRDINPNDIENINVLKDAAAASIWGVRAGNGVIVITTKKGKFNTATRIEVNQNTTVGSKPDIYYRPTTSSGSFIEMERALFSEGFYAGDENNTFSRPPLSPVVELLIAQRDGLLSESQVNSGIERLKGMDVRDDFDRYFMRWSVNQQYALNMSGGGAKNRYYVSAGYDKNEGSFIGNSFDRATFRVENTFAPLKNLELTAGVIYTGSKRVDNNPGLAVLNGINQSKSIYPYAQLADDQGNPLPIAWKYRTPFIEEATANGLLDWRYRPLQDLRNADNTTESDYIRANASLKYEFTDFLDAEVKYQFERSFSKWRELNNQEMFSTRDLINQYSGLEDNGEVTRPIPAGSILDQSNRQLKSHTVRGQLNFNKAWNDHRHLIAAIAGVEVKESRNMSDYARLYGYDESILTSLPIDYITRYRLSYSSFFTSPIPYPRGNTDLINRFRSYYTNASYTYSRKYTISGSARMDASNLFGVDANQRKVPLWSVGGSWNIHREQFMDSSWFNRLQLRMTYGYSGNIDKSVTAYTTTSRGTDFFTQLPNATILNPPNPNLTWEKIGIFNVGVDFETKNRRLSGSLEWYSKKGEDLFGYRQLDPTSGLQRYKGNVASIKGSGFDIELNSLNLDKEFKWSTNLLLSRATNEIVESNFGDLSSQAVVTQQTVIGTSSVQIVPVEGRPIYGLYSYRWGGLDPETGDPRGYLDGEPSTDYASLRLIPYEDLVFHGSVRPTIFGAFRNTFSYKGFSLSANITYKLGYYFRRESVNYEDMYRNWTGHKDFENRWQQPGDEMTTDIPSMSEGINQARDLFYQYSEVLVDDASHVRLQDIRLNYDLNTDQMSLQRLSLYAYVDNVGILWRKNKHGIDPDHVPLSGGTILPLPRSFSIGIKASF